MCGAAAPAAQLGMVHFCRRSNVTGLRLRKTTLASARQKLHTRPVKAEAVEDGLSKKPPYASLCLTIPCI